MAPHTGTPAHAGSAQDVGVVIRSRRPERLIAACLRFLAIGALLTIITAWIGALLPPGWEPDRMRIVPGPNEGAQPNSLSVVERSWLNTRVMTLPTTRASRRVEDAWFQSLFDDWWEPLRGRLLPGQFPDDWAVLSIPRVHPPEWNNYCSRDALLRIWAGGVFDAEHNSGFRHESAPELTWADFTPAYDESRSAYWFFGMTEATGWPLRALTSSLRLAPLMYDPPHYAEELEGGLPLLDPACAWSLNLGFGEFWNLRLALPFRPLWPGFAVNTLFWALVACAFRFGSGRLHGLYRCALRRCRKCGYRRDHAVSAQCPECGTIWDKRDGTGAMR